jgi:hypothetical protein
VIKAKRSKTVIIVRKHASGEMAVSIREREREREREQKPYQAART